jgi:hypothetical protein
MAALSSYTPIATNTLTADGQTVTFSSIPATYTDLVLVINATAVSTSLDISMRFNSDTASNYSRTLLSGSGSTVTSSREANYTSAQINNISQITSTAAAYTGIVHIFNYANTTTFKTALSRSNNAANGVEAVAHLWRKTPEAIHTITLTAGASRDMKTGSSFSLYGIANNTAGAKATGGVISSDSSYFYHSFYATGTFTPTQSLSCDYLVVAGGGGGSRPGGGGGGLAYNPSKTLTTTGYTITVGAGGAGTTGSTTTRGTSGSNSVALSSTATGGGGAGANSSGIQTGLSGGSGGGGSGFSDASAYAGGTGTTGTSGDATLYGNSGGAGQNLSGNNYGGGGGGAGGAGASAVVSTGAAGGIGLEYSISGSSSFYAGGGGGAGGGFGGTGGSSIGGNGKATGEGADGVIGRGGGGGGGADGGGNGGSGVVIIRYAR